MSGTAHDIRELVAEHRWDDEVACERAHRGGVRRPGDARDELVHDRDRIWHSIALRRLQGKTQIFASQWADPMRTRLTHTLEVTQIGRSIAVNVGLPEPLVEAVCLAHDLGHPPFGHVGERALAEVMRRYGGFDANAQTLRLLTHLEESNFLYGGLNLTRATLLGVIKYPYVRTGAAGSVPDGELAQAKLSKAPDGSLFAVGDFLYDESLGERLPTRDDRTFGEWIFDGTAGELLGVEARTSGTPPRTLPCQVMDWADDAAYSVHDLEDGLAAGYIPIEEISSDRFADAITDEVLRRVADASRKPLSGLDVKPESVQVVLGDLKNKLDTAVRTNVRAGIRSVTRAYLNDFIVNVDVQRTRPDDGDFGYELVVPAEQRLQAEVLKSIVIEYVLKDEHVTQYLYKGRRMLQRTFNALMDDVKLIDGSSDQLLPRAVRRELEAGDEAARARAACDYLASMTEGSLTRLYQTLFESSGGSPFR